jgi:single-stranded-DNA-specific exonuclease
MSGRSATVIIEEILSARGIPATERAAFCTPDFARDIHSPWLLKDMERTVTRLIAARDDQEHIVIFGDYDADGIPATALLMRVLQHLGFTKLTPVIPMREHGYGLTDEAVTRLLKLKPDLLITVDNGTVSQHEVATLADAGVDVVIIDHHEPLPEKIAKRAHSIVNPKQEDCSYPYSELCACALAWKVMWALTERLGDDPTSLKWELDLVALSTVADMVPLTGENRALVQFGLKLFPKTRNQGLQALMQVAGVEAALVKAGDMSFKLAPRINAPSRMHEELLDGEQAALNLLTTESKEDAQKLATFLNRQNSERQALVEQHLEVAEAQVANRHDHKVLVVYDETWSTGIIGLVASRLLEKYRRPVVALASEQGEIKGSVRSVDGVHALELLEAASALLERFGGHTKAAGLTLKGTVEELRDALNAYMDGLLITTDQLAQGSRSTDGELGLDEVTLELADALEQLEPFGIGFPTPRFTITAEVTVARRVGQEGKHLSCMLSDGSIQRKAIAFSYKGTEPLPGEHYIITTTLQAEEWRDVRSVVCHVRSIEKKGE